MILFISLPLQLYNAVHHQNRKPGNEAHKSRMKVNGKQARNSESVVQGQHSINITPKHCVNRHNSPNLLHQDNTLPWVDRDVLAGPNKLLYNRYISCDRSCAECVCAEQKKPVICQLN